MNGFFVAAKTLGHVGVYFDEDNIGVLNFGRCFRVLRAKVEITSIVHGAYLHHSNPFCCTLFGRVIVVNRAVVSREIFIGILGEKFSVVKRSTVVKDGTVVGGLHERVKHPGKLAPLPVNVDKASLVFDDFRRGWNSDRREYADITQFRGTIGQCFVQNDRFPVKKAVVHNVAGIDNLHCFISGY
ncbi:MAG: hypothetical protein BWY90_01696 [Deltaproteobacteria bacterium ADurb.BinA014]|nr:MAG: hypothetical protein BWY90_01696 [Deltaproteobacteria bacterium ADurb.BinA014]